MRSTFLNLAALFAILVTLGFAWPAAAATIVDFTDFDSATPDGTDGRDPGFGLPLAISATFDTTQGWTWYTESSTTNDNLTIPFGGGSETIGEQGIRVGGGLELQANNFFFGWSASGTALALRSETFAVGAGTTNVDWIANNTAIKGYYSQNGGSSWTALADAVNFSVATGTLEVVFVGNDAVDSNTLLDTVTISYQSVPTPEPSTLALGLFGLLGLASRHVVRRRTRN